ncbi:GFA family protein [Noviherbaspirillum cavernae]|uniref:GFA family protein n=1 Tax=Noviherbaspirillum cavernae TaxID=2320862 RepID=A0A418X125_9BURK|nr:GFA family protein [Noviherbaspirillum cavernae]RJG06103.1 GFA family protein [Noviherbaspirillum cavernae]
MLRGSCLCGAVAYEISGPFVHIGNCHCTMCRKLHGAAFVTWGILGQQHFRWTRGESQVRSYESSAGRQRLFCSNCGTSLASAHDGRIGEVVIGTLDDDPGARPSEHIFVASKASWYDISDDLPQHPQWPPHIES